MKKKKKKRTYIYLYIYDIAQPINLGVLFYQRKCPGDFTVN